MVDLERDVFVWQLGQASEQANNLTKTETMVEWCFSFGFVRELPEIGSQVGAAEEVIVAGERIGQMPRGRQVGSVASVRRRYHPQC